MERITFHKIPSTVRRAVTDLLAQFQLGLPGGEAAYVELKFDSPLADVEADDLIITLDALGVAFETVEHSRNGEIAYVTYSSPQHGRLDLVKVGGSVLVDAEIIRTFVATRPVTQIADAINHVTGNSHENEFARYAMKRADKIARRASKSHDNT